jgi:parvulin-like peptidyl-prolyl isomerase
VRRFSVLALVFAFVLVAGCGSEATQPAEASPEEQARWRQQYLDDARALQARAEEPVERVTLQHLLVGVGGGRSSAKRSPEEALELAAGLYARARAGEDFDLLVRNYSDDQPPGIYTLALQTGGDALRSEMVRAVGDAAWRLKPGELGVVSYDGNSPDPAAPLGNHLILRLK